MDLSILEHLKAKQRQLMREVPHDLPNNLNRIQTSMLGVIEEVIEYGNSLGRKPWRPKPQPREEQLEEFADILFFFLELKAQSDFTWEEIVREYDRKWSVNIKRYNDLKKGDTSWDKRSEKREL